MDLPHTYKIRVAVVTCKNLSNVKISLECLSSDNKKKIVSKNLIFFLYLVLRDNPFFLLLKPAFYIQKKHEKILINM